MATAQQKVSVVFCDSIAGLADETPNSLERKTSELRKQLESSGFKPIEVETKLDEYRRASAGAIRTGLIRDFSFKPNDKAILNRECALAWAESGICQIAAAA